MTTNRSNMNVEMTADAKRLLTDFCDQQGMTQKAGMTRLLEWFIRQDPVTKAAIVGQLPEMFLDTARDKVKFETPKQEEVGS